MNKIGKLGVFSIVLGSIVGWGSFMLPGTKFLGDSGIINTFIGLFLGAIAIIAIEKNYEFMMRSHKEEGGEFSYTYKHMGQKHGVFVGWFLALAYFTMIPLNATAFPLVMKKLFGDIFSFRYLYSIAGYEVYLGEVLLSSFIIILFAYVNIKGLKNSSKFQNIIIFFLVSMLLLVFMGMVINADKEVFATNYINNYSFNLGQILRVFAITPFAFIGFDAIPQLSNDFNFSTKKASTIAVLALLIGALIYNVLNIITGLAYGGKEVVTLDWAAGSAVLETLGIGMFIALVIALLSAVWSGINGFIICSSKLMGSIACYGMLPKNISQKDRGVYKNAIIFITIITLIAPWFGRQVITWIVDMSSLGASIAYFYVSLIAYKNNKKKLFPLLGIILSIVFGILLLAPFSPAFMGKEAFIALIIWFVIGVMFQFKVAKKLSVDVAKAL